MKHFCDVIAIASKSIEHVFLRHQYQNWSSCRRVTVCPHDSESRSNHARVLFATKNVGRRSPSTIEVFYISINPTRAHEALSFGRSGGLINVNNGVRCLAMTVDVLQSPFA